METIKPIIEELAEIDRAIYVHDLAIKALKYKRNQLRDLRIYCAHEFAPAPKGLEHEGGSCIHCGINEVYAAANKLPICEFCGNPTGGPLPCCNEGAL